MVANMRERGQNALNQIPDIQLPSVVRWLELIAKNKDHSDTEPEELWLLATGELEKMDAEIATAEAIEDWRKYLNDH
jgi:hypothetical protein